MGENIFKEEAEAEYAKEFSTKLLEELEPELRGDQSTFWECMIYKKLYFRLFNRMSTLIETMQGIQQEFEDIYMSDEECPD